MKGYELASWQVSDEWYFSLLVGTNRLKTEDEVKSPSTAIKGVEQIKQRLAQLPRGEQVFWGAGGRTELALPPDPMIDEIQRFCDDRGVALHVSPPR